jgi:MoxR-like ATPase
MPLLKFQQVEQVMNNRYMQRERVVRGLIIALLSGENMLLIGPPGTAKSAIVEDLSKLIDSTYFSHLLTRFSVPEELFGPISYSQLKQDRYMHVPDGMIQQAHVAFIDEIFKANSGVLNAMLNVMNERVYRDAGKVIQIPLRTMIGASNELMESEALNALFDRFLIRYNIDYLDPHGKTELIKSRRKPLSNLMPIATIKDIEVAQAAIEQIDIPDDIIEKYIDIITYLRVNNSIETSDRRDVKVWNVLKAHAWMEGGTKVTVDDFDVLPDMLWRVPEERTEIMRAVIEKAAPVRATINQLLDNAMELIRTAPAMGSDKNLTEGDRVKQLTGVLKQVKQIREDVVKIERNTPKPYVTEAKLKMDGYVGQVGTILKDLMGVTI